MAQLAEEMGAQSRMTYNSEEDTWDASGLRVTDYKHNSRVIFPKAQSGTQENNLEVLRAELLHHHREWEQQPNLSKEEQAGLKEIKKRVDSGNLVILPTDKSGRFALMSMQTYFSLTKRNIKKKIEVSVRSTFAGSTVLLMFYMCQYLQN